MKRVLLIIASLGLLIVEVGCSNQVATPAPQTACGYVQNSDGQRVSWKQQTPINMYFDAEFPTQYYQDVQAAVTTWQNAIGHQVFNIVGTLPPSTPAQDGRSIIYWLSDWDQTVSNEQANTTIYWVENQIVEADLKVNAQNFMYAENPNYQQVDIQSLVLHELGHVLGLKHNTSDPSVMAPSLAYGLQRRDLYTTDLTSMKCEY